MFPRGNPLSMLPLIRLNRRQHRALACPGTDCFVGTAISLVPPRNSRHIPHDLRGSDPLLQPRFLVSRICHVVLTQRSSDLNRIRTQLSSRRVWPLHSTPVRKGGRDAASAWCFRRSPQETRNDRKKRRVWPRSLYSSRARARSPHLLFPGLFPGLRRHPHCREPSHWSVKARSPAPPPRPG